MSCRIRKSKLAPEDQGLQRLGRPSAAASIHMFVAERPMQGCNQGSKVTRLWPTTCCCEYTRVCCRKSQFRPEVKGYQGLQGFGRPTAAENMQFCTVNTGLPPRQGIQGFGRPSAAGSIHTRVAESANSKLHLRAEGCDCSANQLILRAHMHVAE